MRDDLDLIAFRDAQRRKDESCWDERARARLQSDHEDYSRIYTAYTHCAMNGEFDLLPLFVDPAKACVDVGANMGQYALKLAAVAPKCLAIEPLKIYGFMQDCLPANCIFRNVAAGERHGAGLLRSPRTADGTTHFGLSSLVPDKDLGGVSHREQEVEIVTLDELVADALPGEPIGFIKIDVEGYELNVLQGAADTLRAWHPALQVEITENMASILELLDTLHYSGLFSFTHRLHHISQFAEDVHRAPENAWSPERHEQFDLALYVSNFFFVPMQRATGKT